jgi:hypothetical protein
MFNEDARRSFCSAAVISYAPGDAEPLALARKLLVRQYLKAPHR